MYDKAKADRAVNFIRLLKHTKGKWAGVPFNLQPWQIDKIIRPIFGTIDEEGLRQYRTVYLQIGRKNGKSEIASAIALFMLFGDREIGAEVYSAAADKDQAGIVFNTAVQMVKQCKGLMKRCKILDSKKTITVPSTNSFWRVLSSDAYTKHGLNPHAVIFDELHAQPNRELWDVLTTAFGARTQPLLVAMTTAGYDRNSICYEQYDYSQRIIKKDIEDPSYLPLIWEVPADADWRDQKLWKLANPGLGEFRSLPELKQMSDRASQVPALQNTFRRLYLDQWTEQADRWMDMDAWDASAGTVDLEELKGQECYGGLDLASTTDITAFVLLFPREDGTVKIVPHFWIPKDNIHERSIRDKVPYEVWEREGLVTATEGNVVDYATIEKYIKDAADRYVIKEIGFDRWNAIQIVQNLMAEGMEMVGIGQGFGSMAGPSKEFETRILSKTLHHGANPVLRWMMSNVQMKQDESANIKPDKKRSTEKIDGVVATIMALDRVVRHEQDGPSVYETEELLVL